MQTGGRSVISAQTIVNANFTVYVLSFGSVFKSAFYAGVPYAR